MFLSPLFAVAAAVPAAAAAAPLTGGGAEQPSLVATLLPLALIFVLFYFMFIMPNNKEKKKTQEMLAALKEGDKVLTSGGIVGIITKITDKDEVVQISVGENSKLNVLRPYITKKIEKPV